MRRPALLAASVLVLGACSTTAAPPEAQAPTTVDTPATGHAAPPTEDASGTAPAEGAPGTVPAEDAPGTVPTDDAAPADPGPVAAALALVPADAELLTVTDWAAIKARLGAGDLTSESIQTDRSEFWRAVGASTVLLTDGALRAENSRLGLRYDLTQDDVLWEVRWVRRAADGTDAGTGAGPTDDMGGLALRLRPDLDLTGLGRAVADAVPGVAGAQLVPDQHLLLRGPGEQGATLTAQPALVAALAPNAETQVVVPGCLPWSAALGVDATVEDQEAVAGVAAVEDLVEPEAWALAFTGRTAQALVVYPEGTPAQTAADDAAVRLTLAEEWPTTESVGWDDAFGLPPGLTGDGYAVTETGGRVVASADYRVLNPTAAATVALAGLVPWGVCAEVDRLAEPTGL